MKDINVERLIKKINALKVEKVEGEIALINREEVIKLIENNRPIAVWNREFNGNLYCSNCNNYAFKNTLGFPGSYYCPCCGAYMEGEK